MQIRRRKPTKQKIFFERFCLVPTLFSPHGASTNTVSSPANLRFFHVMIRNPSDNGAKVLGEPRCREGGRCPTAGTWIFRESAEKRSAAIPFSMGSQGGYWLWGGKIRETVGKNGVEMTSIFIFLRPGWQFSRVVHMRMGSASSHVPCFLPLSSPLR